MLNAGFTVAWNSFKETEKLVGDGLEIGGKCFDMKENTTILRTFWQLRNRREKRLPETHHDFKEFEENRRRGCVSEGTVLSNSGSKCVVLDQLDWYLDQYHLGLFRDIHSGTLPYLFR